MRINLVTEFDYVNQVISTTGFDIFAEDTIEDAFARAQQTVEGFSLTFEAFVEQYGHLFTKVTEQTSSFYSETLPEVSAAMEKITSPTGMDDFATSLAALQDINLDNLTGDELNTLRRTFPNLQTLLDLDVGQDQLERIAAAGGVRFLNMFDSIENAIDNINFTDLEIGDILFSAEEQEQNVVDRLRDLMATPDIAQGVSAAMNEIFSGAIGGVEISPEDQLALSNTLIDSLPQLDQDTLNNTIFGTVEDIGKIGDISGKSLTELTAKDLELLQKYPGVLGQIRNGTFDIGEFRKQQTASLLEQIQEEIRLAGVRLEQQELETRNILASSEYTEEEKQKAVEALALAKETYNTEVDYLYTLEAVAAKQEEITDSIKEQYKVQLDLLKGRKDSIAQAKQLAALQKESAEIARKSLESTRIGAVGSLEAQFNSQQLNEEIARMNKELQDRIMLAQIEAQQKILEDSQQKAIEQATRENTEAIRENTAATVGNTEATKARPALALDFGATSSIGRTFDSAADQGNALVQMQD